MTRVSHAHPAQGIVGRMAPTPSAGLHVGNVFSCLVAWLAVRCCGGRMLLRIEDLDPARSRREYADNIMRDLDTLGLTWDNDDVMWQSDRTGTYDHALCALREHDLVYPCFCSRADLHAATAPHVGERYLYAGTCRKLTMEDVAAKSRIRPAAMRLKVPDATVCIDDAIQGRFRQNLAGECGDFIIRRSDGVYSYQLAVVVDDIAQGVNQVVRGCDLLDSAPQQTYLRNLLAPDAPRVTFAHVPMLFDSHGRRLSKRDHDQTVTGLLEQFGSPDKLIGHLAYVTGLQDADVPAMPEDLAPSFTWERLKGKRAITWR